MVDISYNDFEKLVINGKYTVHNLWRQKDISNIETKTSQIALKDTAHGVVLYKFMAMK